MAPFRLGAIAASWLAAVLLQYSWVNGGERELMASTNRFLDYSACFGRFKLLKIFAASQKILLS